MVASVVLVVALVAATPWLTQVLAAVNDFRAAGFLEASEYRKHEGTVEDNLNAIHHALMLYVDSEGALPPADSWMDAAWLRLQTGDMSKDEAKKKLVNPRLARAEGEFGFAFNAGLAGQHPDDIKDKTLPLVWESTETRWNATTTAPPQSGSWVDIQGRIQSR